MRRGENQSTRGTKLSEQIREPTNSTTYDAESGNPTPAKLVGGSLAFFNVDCHLFLLTEQLQAYKQASIKHTQAKEELAVSWLRTLLQLFCA